MDVGSNTQKVEVDPSDADRKQEVCHFNVCESYTKQHSALVAVKGHVSSTPRSGYSSILTALFLEKKSIFEVAKHPHMEYYRSTGTTFAKTSADGQTFTRLI